MANWIWFLAAAFVVGVSGQDAGDGCNFMACMAKNEENCDMYTCMKMKKESCGDANQWINMYKGQFKTKFDANEKRCMAAGSAGAGAGANQGGPAGCNFQSCMSQQGCDMFNCLKMKKDSCADVWSQMYTGDFKTQYDANEKSCASGDGAAATECDFQPCMSKTECELFNCVDNIKKGCTMDNIWKAIYVGDFKKNYDTLSDKCGCGSLQASLLFVLASAILVFFRSSF